MSSRILISLVALLLLSGCNRRDGRELNQKEEQSVEINKIEKNITHRDSNIGCNGDRERECREKRSIDSADFILNALNSQNRKNRIREGLENLADGTLNNRDIRDKMDNLVEKSSKDREIEDIQDRKISTPPAISKDVKVIKKSLEELIDSSSHSKSLKIKRDIEKLVERSVDKRDILKTKKTLEHLVDEIENKKSSSLTDMTKALIDDIAQKRVDIVKETDKYFIIRVKKGDTLSLLAQRYYKDSRKFKIIYNANRDKINSNFEIFPNTTLKIPKI